MDGVEIYAKIGRSGEVYETLNSAVVVGGAYASLSVSPPSILYGGATINFFAWMNGVELQAAETVEFNTNVDLSQLTTTTLNLTFTSS